MVPRSIKRVQEVFTKKVSYQQCTLTSNTGIVETNKIVSFKKYIPYQDKYSKIYTVNSRLFSLKGRKEKIGMEYYERVGIWQKKYHCFLILSALASQWNKRDI